MNRLLEMMGLKLKMGLIVGLFTFLVGLFAYALLSEWNDSEYFSQKELYGTDFYAPSLELMQALQLHRGNAIQVVLGNQAAVAPMAAAASKIDAALQALQGLESKYSAHFTRGEMLNEIARSWQTLKANVRTMPPAEGFTAHTRIVEQVHGYIEWFSDQFNLTLDPEIDTFYLMQLASFTLPRAIEFSARLRGQAAGAVAGGDINEATLNKLLSGKPIAVDKVDDAIRSATKANDSVGGVLKTELDILSNANKDFSALVQDLIDNRRSALGATEVFGKGTVLVDAGYALAGKTVPELQRLLQIRVDGLKSKNQSALVELVIAFAFALVMTVLVIRNVLTNLGRANQYLASIQRGNLDNHIDAKGRDELALLLRGIQEMQASLRDNREREKAAAEELSKAAEETRRIARESKRIADALEVCDTPVMLADNDFNITFMNGAVKRMLSNREKELAQSLPGFALDKLLGGNMDRFHKNPAHQRDMMAKLKEVYRTTIKTGGLTFRLTATPLFDEDRNRTGTIVEWIDLTDQLAREQAERSIANENLRVRIALDNSSTNTMIADADNTIVFMNETLKEMMQEAESDLRRDLPNFNASKLLGANMDIFHRNPAHQQALIRNLTSTYQADIKVGGRSFRLTANPVVNDKNERLGTVVEWLDRTQEVQAETEVQHLVQAASAGDFSRRIDELGKQGFFAGLARSLNQLMTVANAGLNDVARVLGALARGDLTQRIDAEYQGLFAQLKNDANSTVEKLEEVITRITEAASAVSTGASEIASGNADLSQRTEEQASSLEETASSMEEMTSTVKQTSDNAQQANQMSSAAVKKAESGGEVVRSAVTAMAEINVASKKIADIIGVIDEIAFQTNLLALNAAVEAARAGEQGRGFAVVAGEVRNLAQRSAGAAKEIKELIRDSVSKVETGTELVNASGTTLSEIVGAIRDVSTMIADINAAAREQTASIVQINQAVSQMDEMTQQNAALVEEASAAGEAMAEQARGLIDLIGFFSLDNAVARPAGKSAAAPVRASAPARSARPAPSRSASTDDEWEEF